MAHSGLKKARRDLEQSPRYIIEAFLHERYGDCMEFNSATDLLEQLRAAGVVMVPNRALQWLFGEVGTFTPPEGAKGAFWWRTEFRRLAGLRR